MSQIYLLAYNNYFNRIVKRETNLSYYISNSNNNELLVGSINFAPKDGIATSLTVNPVNHRCPYDYLLVVDDNDITSRWFILEANQTRQGQFILSLRRDVLADYYDQVISSPCYIEKATVPSAYDVAIYNSESLEVNQIKQSETRLYDESQVAWLVGYYTPLSETITGHTTLVHDADYTVSTLEDWEENKEYTWLKSVSDFKQDIRFNNSNDSQLGLKKSYFIYNSYYSNILVYSDRTEDMFLKLNDLFKTIPFSDYINEVYNYDDEATYNYHLYKYIKTTSDNKLYEIRPGTITTQTIELSVPINSSIMQRVKQILLNNNISIDETNLGGLKIEYIVKKTSYRFIAVTTDTLYWRIPSAAHNCNDAPYKMFAIPYGSVRFNPSQSSAIRNSLNELDTLLIATQIATNLGGFLVDIQLLPYCPSQNIIVNDNEVHLPHVGSSDQDSYFTYIRRGEGILEEVVGFILFPTSANFSFNIELGLGPSDDVVERKVLNQTHMLRLCSPNSASIFEFNLVKSEGFDFINVDCTYKPISPYIHLTPNWSGLYGQDFDDTRGLICSGDFSITIINDQWINYQINNKNYQNSFDRQIEVTELQNKWALAGSITSAVSGTASGALAGARVGGPAGAIAGGIASAAGGITDVIGGQQLREASLQLTKDNFNFSLQNIQALPQTCSKVSTFNANNKVVPFLEEYDCTEQEREALKEKMKYDGMTIMRIGKIQDFLREDYQYIKGQMIRIENVNEDYHLVVTIAEEIAKGVYI